MTDPIWFVVERGAGGAEVACVYHGILPYRLTRKGAGLMVYSLRLDRLPDAERWASTPTPTLYRHYLLARDQGKLIQNTTDPPREKGKQGRLLGEWWEPKPVPFHHDPRLDKPPPLAAEDDKGKATLAP